MTPLESHPTQTDVKPMNDPRANAGGALPRWKRWIDCTVAIVLLAVTTPIILLSIPCYYGMQVAERLATRETRKRESQLANES